MKLELEYLWIIGDPSIFPNAWEKQSESTEKVDLFCVIFGMKIISKYFRDYIFFNVKSDSWKLAENVVTCINIRKLCCASVDNYYFRGTFFVSIGYQDIEKFINDFNNDKHN